VRTAFKTQDQIFDLLRNDQELMTLLGSPATDEEINIKLKREMTSIDVFNTDDLDFISFYFINAMPTRNHKVNRGVLVIDYFTSLRYNAGELSERVKTVLADKLDLQIMSEGQIPSGIVGVYQYRQRFMPLIWG